ncbi:MAG TPA: gas vesicle protein [Pyrinomonadaceae bacterium]|jgi:hypothetical protein|nr:gas vesicle protein [Pyrinomonadaceae bacterium]
MDSSFEQVTVDSDLEFPGDADLSLLETLDHVLNRGLVIAGEITISVADVDLIFVGLNVLVSSVETAHEVLRERQRPSGPTSELAEGPGDES